jgi:hypothetical protein
MEIFPNEILRIERSGKFNASTSNRKRISKVLSALYSTGSKWRDCTDFAGQSFNGG